MTMAMRSRASQQPNTLVGCALTIAWQRAETVLHLPFVLSPALALFSVLGLVAIASVYLLEAVRHPGEIVKVARRPVPRRLPSAPPDARDARQPAQRPATPASRH